LGHAVPITGRFVQVGSKVRRLKKSAVFPIRSVADRELMLEKTGEMVGSVDNRAMRVPSGKYAITGIKLNCLVATGL
jgi:hypothetical protein